MTHLATSQALQLLAASHMTDHQSLIESIRPDPAAVETMCHRIGACHSATEALAKDHVTCLCRYPVQRGTIVQDSANAGSFRIMLWAIEKNYYIPTPQKIMTALPMPILTLLCSTHGDTHLRNSITVALRTRNTRRFDEYLAANRKYTLYICSLNHHIYTKWSHIHNNISIYDCIESLDMNKYRADMVVDGIYHEMSCSLL